jgi:hypothetical protein
MKNKDCIYKKTQPIELGWVLSFVAGTRFELMSASGGYESDVLSRKNDFFDKLSPLAGFKEFLSLHSIDFLLKDFHVNDFPGSVLYCPTLFL